MLCRVCNSEKQPSDFYAGMASRCKDCHKAAMKLRRLTNPYVQEYDRLRSTDTGPQRAGRGYRQAMARDLSRSLQGAERRQQRRQRRTTAKRHLRDL